jgi:LCCL domain
MSWKNWGDHPVAVSVSIFVSIAGLLWAIYTFYAPTQNPSVPPSSSTPVIPDPPTVPSTEVELIVQTEQFAPLENVEVRFITKGAPEVRITDSNGYTRLRIPSRGDIEVILSRKDFETLRLVINLENDSNRTRTYQLKKLDAGLPPVSVSPPKRSTIPEPVPSPSLPQENNNQSENHSISWTDTVNRLSLRQSIGQKFTFRCPPSRDPITRLYGTDIYTGHSSICEAAVHSGVITQKQGGKVTIEVYGKQQSFEGSQRFGVLSRGNGAYYSSFVIIP